MSTITPPLPDVRGDASDPTRNTRCAYLSDDLVAAVDAIVAIRRRGGESRLKRSHVVEEALEAWLALNSQKYDYRIPSNGHAETP